MTKKGCPVGIMLGSALAPERIPDAAIVAEELGFSSVWVSEDYYCTGGISSAATILARTERVRVGLGVVSAMTRHPALLAMEISTLARMHPGRLCPAVGLGMPQWLAEMGLKPASSLQALRSCVTSLRALLAGEELTTNEGPFKFDHVRLTHPLSESLPPIWVGVSGPAMLRLAGAIADGIVISVKAGVDYVRWARDRITEGFVEADRTDELPAMNVYTFMSVDEDGKRARAAVRHRLALYLASRPDSPVTRAYGITDQLQELAAGGPDRLEREMPDQWVDDLAVAGNASECADKIERLLDAGADAVTLYACPVERAEELIRRTGETVLPLVAQRPVPPSFSRRLLRPLADTPSRVASHKRGSEST